MTTPRDTLKTSARVNGIDDVDLLLAVCAFTGQRPHEIASSLLTDYLAAFREDPELGPPVLAMVEHARAHQLRDVESGEPLSNVIPLRGRRNA